MLHKPLSTKIFCFFLLASVVAVYGVGLSNQMVFDDARFSDGSIFGQYGNSGDLKQRMLSYGSFAWVQSLVGENWPVQRAINVLFHMGTVAGLYVFTNRLLARVEFSDEMVGSPTFLCARDRAAMLGVAVYALNPVAVYAVGYLIQRSIVMAACFAVWSLVAFFVGIEKRRVVWFGAALLLYVLAVLSKEHAVLLVVFALPLYVFMARPSKKLALQFTGAVLLVFGLTAAWLFTVYGDIFGQTFDDASRAYVRQLEALRPGVADKVYELSLANQLQLFFKYGLLWFFPNVMWMSMDMRPAFPLELMAVSVLVGAVAYVGLLVFAVALVFRKSDAWGLLGLLLLFPLLMFGTEFSTVWVQDPFVLYRSYLWALTVPGLVALACVWFSPTTVLRVGVVWVLVLAPLSVERLLSLKDPITAWTDAVDKIDLKAPANAVGRDRAFSNRGAYLFERGNYPGAAMDYQQAIALGDPQGNAWYNYGEVLQKQNQHVKALDAFSNAAKRGFSLPVLWIKRGDSLVAMGDFPSAYEVYSLALKKPLTAQDATYVRMMRAESGMRAGKLDVALADYDLLLAEKPNDARLLLGVGMTHLSAKRFDKALAIFERLISESGAAEAFYGRAMVLLEQGNRTAALADFDRAAAKDPANAFYKNIRNQVAAQRK